MYESYTSVSTVRPSRDELAELSPEIDKARMDPKRYWEERREETFEGFERLLSETDEPELEICIPVHNNADELRALLPTIARQEGLEGVSVGCTILLHNSDDETLALADEIIAQLGSKIRFVELNNQMLHGAYYGWQYLMATSRGDEVLVVDADSAVIPTWGARMRESLEEDNTVAAVADRVFFTGAEDSKIGAFNKVKDVKKSVTSILGREPEFIAGNSIVQGELGRDVARQLLGFLDGDVKFGEMIRDRGVGSVAACDALILNNGDKYDELTYMESIEMVVNRARKMVGISKRGDGSNKNKDGEYFLEHQLSRYCAWVEPIVDDWLERGSSMTMNEIVGLFASNAEEGGYSENDFVRSYLNGYDPNLPGADMPITHPDDFADHLRLIALACFTPTMIYEINNLHVREGIG